MQAESNGDAIIRVENFTAAYDDHVILKDVAFEGHRGEIFVILGGSGSGKSTLLKHMIGLHEPRTGRILLDDEDLVTANEGRRAAILKKIGVTHIDLGQIPWPDIFRQLLDDGYDGVASVETHLFSRHMPRHRWLQPATIDALRNLNRVLAEVQGRI